MNKKRTLRAFRARFIFAAMSAYKGMPQIWPVWVKNIAKMRKHRTVVIARCMKCGTATVVTDADLRALEHIFGPWYSLIDKRPQCKVIVNHVRCPGRVFFTANGPGDCRVIPLMTRSDMVTIERERD